MQSHCWYSQSQDAVSGHVIYLVNGKEVKVTNVSHTTQSNEWNAADSVYLGIGVFVRITAKSEKFIDNLMGGINKLPEYQQADAYLEKLNQFKKIHHSN